MRSRPASTAKHPSGRPTWRLRWPSPITGCRPAAQPLAAIIWARRSRPRAMAAASKAAIVSPPPLPASRPMRRRRPSCSADLPGLARREFRRQRREARDRLRAGVGRQRVALAHRLVARRQARRRVRKPGPDLRRHRDAALSLVMRRTHDELSGGGPIHLDDNRGTSDRSEKALSHLQRLEAEAWRLRSHCISRKKEGQALGGLTLTLSLSKLSLDLRATMSWARS